MTKHSFSDLVTEAIKLAKRAGNILLTFRDKASIVTRKGHPLDYATEADMAAEEYLRSAIRKKFPGHGILGEEQGEQRGIEPYTWIVDPLDGTLDFTRGMPSFGVLIAVEHEREVVVGCIYQPVSKDLFVSSSGMGVQRNGRSVHVSDISSFQESVIHFKLPRCVNSPEEIRRTVNALRTLASQTGLIREAWEDSVSLANIASGASEAFVLLKEGPKWWDVAPGVLMVEEAGGIVTDMFGKPIKNRDLSNGIIATNGKIHDQLLSLIRKELV